MRRDNLPALADRARRLKEWSDGPDGLMAIFDAVETALVLDLKASVATDTALREAIYHRLQAVGHIRTVMQEAIAAGQASDPELIEKKMRKFEHR